MTLSDATRAKLGTPFKDIVTKEEVRKGRSIIGVCPAMQEKTREDSAAWRKVWGR